MKLQMPKSWLRLCASNISTGMNVGEAETSGEAAESGELLLEPLARLLNLATQQPLATPSLGTAKILHG